MWLLRSPNGKIAIHEQIDRGPNQALNREFDLTPKALAEHGYTTDNFPTDQGEWVGVYLGTKDPGQAQQRAAQISSGAAGASLGDLFKGLAPVLGVPDLLSGNLPNPLDTVKQVAGAAYDVMKWLFGEDARSHWIRIGAVIAGMAIVGIGLYALANILSGGRIWEATKDAGKASAEAAATVALAPK